MAIRHFLSLRDLSPAELEQVINLAIEMKAAKLEDRQEPVFAGKVLGMIFEKSSTRTRVSFEAGMAQLGGDALFLSPNDTQLGRGEPIEDSARVISRMVDMVMIRTHGQEIAERFAAYSRVPVINALTDKYHPCQLLADIQTFTEHRGSIKGKTVAWIGDGNNMCNSWINAAIQFNFNLQIACPAGYEPCADLLAEASNLVSLSHNPVDHRRCCSSSRAGGRHRWRDPRHRQGLHPPHLLGPGRARPRRRRQGAAREQPGRWRHHH